MIYVTSDLHGYPLPDFLRLLGKADFSDADELIILGDVIDRNGDGGIAMLRWMLQQVNVRIILGNHEAMLLSCRFLFDTITDESLARFDSEGYSVDGLQRRGRQQSRLDLEIHLKVIYLNQVFRVWLIIIIHYLCPPVMSLIP